MKIAIINGPNLNLTGERETNLYGSKSFEALLEDWRKKYKDEEFTYFQSNVEGEIINKLQETGAKQHGILLNAGGYTHTSVAIADAVRSISIPVIEVHLSNIFAREDFRHVSFTGAHCAGCISGLGMLGYELGLLALLKTGR